VFEVGAHLLLFSRSSLLFLLLFFAGLLTVLFRDLRCFFLLFFFAIFADANPRQHWGASPAVRREHIPYGDAPQL
jgi:hypothetical protein